MLKNRVQRLEALRRRCPGRRREPGQVTPRSLETAQDVIALLLEQIEAVCAAAWTGPVEKARAIGYLAEIVRKTQETDKLAGRLEMLERVLKQRTGETSR